MRYMPYTPALILLFCALSPCSFGAEAPPAPPAPQFAPGSDIDRLRQELQGLIQDQLQKGALQAAPQSADEFKARARALAQELRARIQAELARVIERELGPVQALQLDTISLEALDRRGRTIQVPVTIQARPLRMLMDPTNLPKTDAIVGTGNLALALYDELPEEAPPADSEVFWRKYEGDAARAIEAEARLLVALKGGAWAEPAEARGVANAVAIRGLDFDKGLLSNGNRTYDDTMYLVLHSAGQDPEVYEYRMTTESSSPQRGVGRLDSKQVTYVRGLHRGKDPAYKLKEAAAEGTRTGLEGTYKITGANIHSAYAKRIIDSSTPLSPKVSLGCQVVAAGKKPFEKSLVFLLDEKGIKEFPYTIVDGDELTVLDHALLQHQHQSVLVHAIPRPEASPSPLIP